MSLLSFCHNDSINPGARLGDTECSVGRSCTHWGKNYSAIRCDPKQLPDRCKQYGTCGNVTSACSAAGVCTVESGPEPGPLCGRPSLKGTATVLTCSTVSASISFLLARSLGRDRLLTAAQESKQFRAIDAAFADASFGTSLTLITLLRLSPVLPFACAPAGADE